MGNRDIHSSRFGAALLLFLALAALLLPLPARAGPTSQEARIAWGFDRSDLAPHPGVRFGVLPNGMRYAIMRNAAPAGALSIRLRFDAGAKIEDRKEQGYLHLIEHLLFQGTVNIPEGSLPLMLAHRGLRHWSDVNAFTSFDETVYRIDMTRADAAAREAAMLVMREVATNLVFTKRTVRGAKRDVKAEIKARDSAQDRMLSAMNAFFFPGTAIDRGPVAGTRSQISNADEASLRRLYDTYYVPQRAVLILVGDFDPDSVEAEIIARFANWPPGGRTAPPLPAPAIRVDRGLEARLFVASGAPTTVTIATVTPLGTTGDQGRTRDSRFLETLAAEMFNRRLARLAARAEAPFTRADLAIYDHYSTALLARIEIEAKGRNWRLALREAASELRAALDSGFTQSELDGQIAGSRAVPGRDSSPRTTPALADAIADAVNRGIVFTKPAGSAGADAYLAQVRLTDVNAAFRSVWARPGPLVFVTSDRRDPKAEVAILTEWREAQGTIARVEPY